MFHLAQVVTHKAHTHMAHNRLCMVVELGCLTLEDSRAVEQQLGALLQAQQMQQNMLELMNHFASVEKSERSTQKVFAQMEQSNCLQELRFSENPP